jgi:hypothetical protein
MKILITESQVKNLKINLNEQAIVSGLIKLLGRTKLGSKIASKVADLIMGGERVVAKTAAKGLGNPNNYKTINNRGFVIADNGAIISIDAINSMVDDIAYGRVSVDQALSNFPKKLKDGTDFKEFFANIPKKQSAIVTSSGIEKLIGNVGKEFMEKHRNSGWVQPRSVKGNMSGWKIHVYADTLPEASYLYEKLLPVVDKYGAGFKIGGGNMLQQLSSNVNQRGKGITIYVPSSTFEKNMVGDLFIDIKTVVAKYEKTGKIVGDKMVTPNIGYRYEFSQPVNPKKGVDMATYQKLYDANRGDGGYNIPNNPDIFK